MPTNDAGNPTEPTVPDAGTPGPQPDYKELYQKILAESAEWRNRFTGLQGTYQREQQRWKDGTAELDQYKTTVDSLTTAKTTLETQLSEIMEKLDAAESEKEITSASLERMKIVMTEFPQLTSFLAKGLIPDETGDELREKLKELSSTIDTIKNGALTDYQAGGSPPQPPKSKPSSSKEGLQAQLLEAFRSNNRAEYDKVYAEILKQSGGPNG